MANITFFTRTIGAFQIDATLEETHDNNLVITEYPVEQGTELSDHAQIRPKKFDIVCGVSDVNNGAFTPGRIQAAYANLVAVQESRVPLTIQSRLTTLNNMMIEGMTVTQDKFSANLLITRIRLKEVITVGVRSVRTQLRPIAADGGDQTTLTEQQTENMAAPTIPRGDVSLRERRLGSILGPAIIGFEAFIDVAQEALTETQAEEVQSVLGGGFGG